MKKSEVIAALQNLPDLEVGDEYANMVLSIQVSTYDDDAGSHDFIALEIDSE